MKKFVAVLLATSTLSLVALPQVFAQTTPEEIAAFSALPADIQALLQARFVGLTAAQIAAVLALPAAEIGNLAALPEAAFANIAQLSPEALQVVAALPLNQMEAVGTLPSAQLEVVAALSPANREAIFVAVTELEEQTLAGNTGALAAAVAALSNALEALPDTDSAAFAVAVAQDLQEAVEATPSDSAARTAASASIGGLTQVAAANGASEAQLDALENSATVALSDAPAPEPIGAIQEDLQGSGTNA